MWIYALMKSITIYSTSQLISKAKQAEAQQGETKRLMEQLHLKAAQNAAKEREQIRLAEEKNRYQEVEALKLAKNQRLAKEKALLEKLLNQGFGSKEKTALGNYFQQYGRNN